MLGSVHVLFMLCLCSVAVHSRLYWFAPVAAGTTAAGNGHYKIELYSGICASICPLVARYVELLASRLACLHLLVCMYEGAVRIR